jgi:hypothetical protein
MTCSITLSYNLDMIIIPTIIKGDNLASGTWLTPK